MADLVFYDVEVFPNLFLVNWKFAGSKTVVRMINPTPQEIEGLMKFRLIGFNCRRYDTMTPSWTLLPPIFPSSVTSSGLCRMTRMLRTTLLPGMPPANLMVMPPRRLM